MPYATYRFNKIIAAETIRFIVTVAIVVYKGLKLVVYRMLTKTQKKVVSVEVEGIPEELIRTGNEERQEVAKDKPKRTTPHKGSIMVTIRTREGLCIQKKGLDYQGLKTLVEKLEGLC